LCLLFLSHFTTSIFQCLVLFSFTFVFAFFDSFMNSRGLVFTPAVLPLLFRISLMFPSHSYIILIYLFFLIIHVFLFSLLFLVFISFFLLQSLETSILHVMIMSLFSNYFFYIFFCFFVYYIYFLDSLLFCYFELLIYLPVYVSSYLLNLFNLRVLYYSLSLIFNCYYLYFFVLFVTKFIFFLSMLFSDFLF
jgi:hypothetical protein